MPDKMRRVAFTLAEVLITLAIIGIIAALTIPNLIQSYKKKVASTRLKTFYSTMQQAIKLSEINNGSAFQWEKEKMACDENGNIINEEQQRRALKFFNTYLANYLKTLKIESSPVRQNMKLIYLPNGSYFEFNNGDCIDFMYDINGSASPNEFGKDIYRFLLCNSQFNNTYHKLRPNNPFGSYAQFDINTREDALEKCKESPSYCSILLEIFDNWEFKDDYPHKL